MVHRRRGKITSFIRPSRKLSEKEGSALTRWVQLIIILIPLSYSITAKANDCEGDLGKWLACNNPRVIQYLEKLSPNDVDTDLEGVSLTDGRNVLGGHRYLGEAKGLGKGVHLYVFEYKGRKLAFLWIDCEGNELSLPSCPDLPSEDTYESSYVLSGDVYTSNLAQPGHGVIQVMCVQDSWLKAIKEETIR